MFSPNKTVISIDLKGMIASGSRAPLNMDNLNGLFSKVMKMKFDALSIVINSPGGSPVQSSLIAQKIREISDKKKVKCYCFVEDVAASGGYWLACAADELYADVNSIVGSIGVISGGFGFTDLIKKIGVEFTKIKDNVLTAFKKDFESINETLGKMAQSGIKAFSRGLAESLVMGKKLNMTMKEIAQKLLVDIVAFTIQLVIQETIRNALKKDQLEKEEKITNELRSQTTEMKRQAILSLFTGGSGGGLPFMANGGAVSKGKPVVVGERGAELFIPNSSGQITQSARGTGGGAVNVNFTINTIDSRGFDQALIENRGTISSIINNALAEKGRGELI